MKISFMTMKAAFRWNSRTTRAALFLLIGFFILLTLAPASQAQRKTLAKSTFSAAAAQPDPTPI